jgi:ABC-type transport system involved in cytochrome bd biosynthesis fused ATPase/permease subunit
MEDIKVISIIDFKTYLNISFRAYYKLRTFITIIVVLVVVEVVLLYSSAMDWWSQIFIVGYLVLFYGILLPLLLYWGAKRNMNKVAALREPLTYTINADKIELKAETMSSSSNWQYVTMLGERENYFLIRTGAKAFHYLPKDGFQSKEDIVRLKEIARQKGIKFSYK